jgi:hypothetical protein
MWRKEVVIQCKGISQYYIDVVIQDGEEWRLTGIYGEPSWDHKERTWDALRSLHNGETLPWLVLGDFNEILFHHEKEGGRMRAPRQMQAFHDILEECDLVDIGYIGDMFTWQRGKIRERLDRGVAHVQWRFMFPNAQLVNAKTLKSDHRPIVVDTEYLRDHIQGNRGPRRFEARWLKEETVEEVVQAAWTRARAHDQGPTFMMKANQVHNDLHKWDRETLKQPVHRIKRLKKELENLRRGPITDETIAQQKEVLLWLEFLLEQEEIFWVQRARANWLKHGDRNTSFFHHFASSRRKKNLVRGLV